jgi:hypothetical protein
MISKNRKVTILFSFFLIILVMVFIESCSKTDEVVSTNSSTSGGNNSTSTEIIVNGVVISNLTGIPINGASVLISGTSISINRSLLTDSTGKYSDTIETSSNINLVIIVEKSGYANDTTDINVSAGVNTVPVINLIPSNSTGTKPSGNPVSIYLYSQSATSIGVQGSGSPATATITFVAVDSSGSPIDLDHSVNVGFSFGANPGGGAVLSPDTVSTNESGLASVNLTSGTIAGVVQIYAALFSKGVKIYSKPVAISIFGGLPDSKHFSIAPAEYNFPGYDIFGLTDVISAFVGDKYGNPARPGTSVYFTTTGGIIGGSANTNSQGVGTVSLLSAAPQPTDLILGSGFATITASTADENLNTISTNISVLFSGAAEIDSISPTSFNIPNGGSQTFNYKVCDENQNPLASGTTISVSITGPSVADQGDVQVNLPDTKSKYWTHFSFLVYDTDDTTNIQEPITVQIFVTGPNGSTKSPLIMGYSH